MQEPQLAFDFPAIVDALPPLDISALARAPYVGIDECCNHPLIHSISGTLLARRLAARVTPLWEERRIRTDGSALYVVGGLSKGDLPDADLGDVGVAERGARWDDQKVLAWLLGLFPAAHPVVLLTENTRMDELGLRWLLNNLVAPALAKRTNHHLSLSAIFKSGSTSYPSYCAGIVARLEEGGWRPGYDELVL